ncbi:MAG: hypothetical protein ACOX3T_04425 [Bdellovibrionota bacterium]
MEFCIALLMLLLIVPCIVNSSLKDYKIQTQNKIKFLDTLDNSSNICTSRNVNSLTVLKCKNKYGKTTYKIKTLQ